MTVSSEVTQVTHNGNGVTTSFAIPFYFISDDHIILRRYDVLTDTPVTVTPGAYSIVGAGDPAGGTLTYEYSGSPLSSAYYIIISRELPITQELDITRGQAFLPDAIEMQLDKIVMQVQQVNSALDTATGAGTLQEIYEIIAEEVLVVNSIAALRLLDGLFVGTVVEVVGWYDGSRIGGGKFILNTNDITSADNYGTIIVDLAARRWVRANNKGYFLDYDFGVKDDRVTDDRVNLQKAVDWLCLATESDPRHLVSPPGPGRLLSSGKVTGTVVNRAVGSWTSYGHGAVFLVNNAVGGIELKFGGASVNFLIDGLCPKPARVASGFLLHAYGDGVFGTGGVQFHGLTVRNVNGNPETPTTSAFYAINPFNFARTARPVVENLQYRPGKLVDQNTVVFGDYLVCFDNAYGAEIDRYVLGGDADVGIRCVHTSPIEGFLSNNGRITTCEQGFKFSSTPQPGIEMHKTHLNSLWQNGDLDGVNRGRFKDCMFYANERTVLWTRSGNTLTIILPGGKMHRLGGALRVRMNFTVDDLYDPEAGGDDGSGDVAPAGTYTATVIDAYTFTLTDAAFSVLAASGVAKTRWMDSEFNDFRLRNVTLTYFENCTFGHQGARLRRHFNADGEGSTVNDIITITGVTKANPGVATYSGDDLLVDGSIVLWHVTAGMTQLNGVRCKVAGLNVGANTFQLTDMEGVNIDTTAYTTFTAGTIEKIDARLDGLKFFDNMMSAKSELQPYYMGDDCDTVTVRFDGNWASHLGVVEYPDEHPVEIGRYARLVDAVDASDTFEDRSVGGLINAVFNGKFTRGERGWTTGVGWEVLLNSIQAQTGSSCMRYVAASTATVNLMTARRMACKPGDVVRVEWSYKVASGTVTTHRVQVVWYDIDGVELSTSDGANSTSAPSTYTSRGDNLTAPANAVAYAIRIRLGTSLGATVYIDEIFSAVPISASIPDGDKGDVTVSSGGTAWAVKRPYTYLQALTADTGVTDRAVTIDAAVDALAATGGTVQLPPGRIAIGGSGVSIPNNVHLVGSGEEATFLVPLNTLTNGMLRNATTSTSDYVAEDIGFSNFTIDDTRTKAPAWRSNAAGTPIADPEADYRVGGCLAPTVFATANATVSGGKVTGTSGLTGGSGYTNLPAVWVTGDGYGARITATIAAGAVTALTVSDGGVGYTTATIEIAGGGADPVTALYAADRRNANYASVAQDLILLRSTKNARVERITVRGCELFAIVSAGNSGLVIRDCTFDACGKIDEASGAIWAGAYSTLEGRDITVENNKAKDLKRLFILIDSHNVTCRGNVIDGFKESCFFVPNNDYGITALIDGNIVRNGLISDIVCSAMEAEGSVKFLNNRVHNVDSEQISMSGPSGGWIVRDNYFDAPASRALTKPFGPFSERVAYAAGVQPVAGEQLAASERNVVNYKTQTAVVADAPQFGLIEGNELRHDAEFSITITAVTKANPGVATYSGADNLRNGDMGIFTMAIGGMVELNNVLVVVAGVNTGANTFQLTDINGANINTTAYTTFTTGTFGRRAAFNYLIGSRNGAINSQGGLVVRNNSAVNAQGCDLIDMDTTNGMGESYNLAKRLIVEGNVGFDYGADLMEIEVRSNFSRADDTSTQDIFDAPDTFNLDKYTRYEFEGVIVFINGAVAHDIDLSFSVGSAVSLIHYIARHRGGAVATYSASTFSEVEGDAVTAMKVAQAITNTRSRIEIKGVVETAARTTFKPQFAFSAASGSCSVGARTRFKLRRVGLAGQTSYGDVT